DPAAFLDLATLLTRMERYQDAAEVYLALTKLEPGTARHYVALGESYFAMKAYDRAATAWLTALAHDPQNKAARQMLPQTYYRRRDYEKAWEAVAECQKMGVPLDG